MGISFSDGEDRGFEAFGWGGSSGPAREQSLYRTNGESTAIASDLMAGSFGTLKTLSEERMELSLATPIRHYRRWPAGVGLRIATAARRWIFEPMYSSCVGRWSYRGFEWEGKRSGGRRSLSRTLEIALKQYITVYLYVSACPQREYVDIEAFFVVAEFR